MRLYSGPLSMFGMKAEIALREKAIPFELTMVAYDRNRGYEPKHPDVLRINPKRQVPVLVDGALEIFDSTQIFEYLEDIAPEPRLWPGAAQDRGRARLLEMQSDEVYFPHIVKLMNMQDGLSSEPAVAALDAAERYYQGMENQLGAQDYLAGAYSYADIAFFMAQVFGERMSAVMTEATPRLLAWRDRMTTRPAVADVMTRLVAYLRSEKRPVPNFLSGVRT